MRWCVLACCLMVVLVTGISSAQDDSFVICYKPDVSATELARYDLIVVDYAYPPAAVASLTAKKKTVLGYLSLGKVQNQRPFVADMRRLNIGMVQDAAFPDSFRVDVADPNWHKLVINTLIPEMKKAGFSGLFLDDLDDIRVRNLEKHGVKLIHAIRQAHPDLKLMANRGLEYLPDFAASIDYSLLESCYIDCGKLRPKSDPEWAMGKLAAGKQVNPKPLGFAVDYYAKVGGFPLTNEQQDLIATVRVLHKESGLRSCLTTQDLQYLPPQSSACGTN